MEAAPPPSDPVFFPPVQWATEDGLLMVGGNLTPDWLLEAYSRGIFPWPVPFQGEMVLAWFCPDPRAVLELDSLHISRRLRRRMRSGRYRVTQDRDFRGVLAGCAEPRVTEGGTWITAEMADAYQRLHELGFAHSVEVWEDDVLVGGIYGVTLGGLFAGESMFHRTRDASKIAIAHLVEHLRERGYCLFDVQLWTSHLASLGAVEISRADYLRRLKEALRVPATFR